MTCCERLHTSANIAQQETTFLGPTMLRVVASVCTGLAKRLQHFYARFCNIVGHNMLHTFGHPVAICCNMVDDVGSNLKTVKFFVQHFRCCMMLNKSLKTALGNVLCSLVSACALGPLLARQGPGTHEH